MIAHIRTVHGRILSIAAALLAYCVSPSCSNDGAFDLTLVLRDDLSVRPFESCTDPEFNRRGEPCLIYFEEQLWRDEAGRRAVVPARMLTVAYVEQGFGEFACGDRMVEDARSFLADPTPGSAPFRLELEDGNVLELSEEEGLEVSNFRDVCVEYSGSWRGVAGEVQERTGSFRMINDSVQIVLHLVED